MFGGKIRKIAIFTLFSFTLSILNVLSVEPQTAYGAVGDVFVMSETGSAVYLLQNGQKYHIRTPELLASYGVDFSSVRKIPQHTLNRFPHATLVKVNTSNKVYFLDYAKNKKHWQVSEEILTRYGNDVHNVVTITADDLNAWPDVLLVKSLNDPNVYLLDGNTKRHIPTERDFNAFHFLWSDVVTIADFDLRAYTPVNALAATESELQRFGVRKNNTLRVEYIASAPQSFAAYSQENTYMTVAFVTAQYPVQINSLTFKQHGTLLGEGATIWLSERKYTEMYGDRASLGSEFSSLYFQQAELVIPPFSKRVFEVKVDLSGITGEHLSHALSLHEVKTSDGIVQTSLRSPFHHIVFDKSFVSAVGVDILPMKRVGRNELLLGSVNQPIAQFLIQSLKGENDLILEKLILTNRGTYELSDLENITLRTKIFTEEKKNKKKNTIQEFSPHVVGNKLVFDLPSIAFTKELNLFISADIAGDAPNRFIKFAIEQSTDLHVLGKESQKSIPVQAFGLYDSTFPIGDGAEVAFNAIKVVDGRFELVKPASGSDVKIYAGAKDVSFLSFTVKNTGTEARLDAFDLVIHSNASAPLEDIYLKAQKITGDIFYNGEEYHNHVSTVKLRETIIIPENSQSTITLYADIPQLASAQTYQMEVKNFHLVKKESNRLHTLDESVTGKKFIVEPFAFAAFARDNLTTQELFAGKNRLVGQFWVQNDSGESVSLKKVTLRPQVNAGILTAQNGFLTLRVNNSGETFYFDSEQFPYTFNVDITIPKGKRQLVNLYLSTENDVDALVAFEITQIRVSGMQSEYIQTLNFQSLSAGSYQFKAQQ